ncbi:hypothetical protein [Aulosira sp. FACHB-615]|uniref:hypothetical protein n=1 Tax=Aulosira sp. FACHB-615 TaxID=2692777 RepID=UPI00168456F9|nr:hypothetical protein [Aulosira sp. FACHB-615]MBD2489391.1 hypothetical protein [Aulosira sp. FACHB-615]
MKKIKCLLLTVILFASLVFAQPALADRPKVSKNPDYITLTKELEQFLSAKTSQQQLEDYTPEQIDQKINELELQKYAFESGIDWGQCTNQTGQTIAIYGPEPNLDDDEYSETAALYFLPDGATTQDRWNCKGIYLPADVNAVALNPDRSGQEFVGDVVVKVPNGTNLVLKTNPDTGVIEFNQVGAKILPASDVNWYIPKVSQTIVEAHVATAPTKKG